MQVREALHTGKSQQGTEPLPEFMSPVIRGLRGKELHLHSGGLGQWTFNEVERRSGAANGAKHCSLP